jgi:hypothetical protein
MLRFANDLDSRPRHAPKTLARDALPSGFGLRSSFSLPYIPPAGTVTPVTTRLNIEDFRILGPLQNIFMAAEALQPNKDSGFMSFQTVTFCGEVSRTVTFCSNGASQPGKPTESWQGRIINWFDSV